MSSSDGIGWDRLRHGGLLLDAARLRRVAENVPRPLSAYDEHELRRLAATLDDKADVPAFVGFVLEKICGFGAGVGSWQRGSQVGSDWGRPAVTGEIVKPRQLWRGSHGAILPVFFDAEPRLGIGRARKTASQVVQWLRAGTERLALLTNGRQWRLIFAGLDFDAWCEWDADLWFEEGGLSPQVQALRTLIAPALWTPEAKEAPAPLLQAILDSRKGQAELSALLGERVREAVELLVQAHGDVLSEKCADVDPADIYRAAVRIVMRMVVVLFAESRELLPRSNTLYHSTYGLTGLLEDLERSAARGGNRLARTWSAWPRVLGLFRLVHAGSHHPELLVPEYGGELFAPGELTATDGLSRAQAVFETATFDREILPDREVHRILDRITRTRVKVRQGRASTWVPTPVDFSDLSSEYIGILYEGLLDFELRTAPPGDPIVFLAVGNQPALPLSRLEAMDDKALADLLEKMKDTSTSNEDAATDEEADTADDDERSEVAADDGEEDEDVEPTPDLTAAVTESEGGDVRHATRTRAETWGRRAAVAGKLVRKPRGALTPAKQAAFEEAVAQKARQLIARDADGRPRLFLPGEWYLVRWGGTRKGSGTFYTRPGLAVPTVQRTLRPLTHDPPRGPDGQPDPSAPPATWSPKRPEEILALKVCDPACGSGTFPVAALRFLTEALYASLHHHGRITAHGERAVVRLLAPLPSGGATPDEALGQELLPCRPDDDTLEARLKPLLRRHVVERCIYGVDLDPLAVELCRLALWIETMDRTLPFSFLDHKIKCGNSLLGAWFDAFPHYPVMAWRNREEGDSAHANGVHFEKHARTRAIKSFVKETLTPDIRALLEGRTLFSEDLQHQAIRAHTGALATLSRLHALPVQDSASRAQLYRDELLASRDRLALKEMMDLWCSCWFWPTDALHHAPLPTTFSSPSPKTLAIARHLAVQKRFFHWELEFPDVFRTRASGFDAILGNPPWDIAKPHSMEFFSNIDPLYRSYGKQEALRHQSRYFADPDTERAWLDYSASFRAQSNFFGHVARPFGDPADSDKSHDRFSILRTRENETRHAAWREARAATTGFADSEHPFRYQGSGDTNLYKAFLEQAHALLRTGGRLGFIVPSGIHSDHGTVRLRELLLDRCGWEWLFNFINWEKIFPAVYYRFKFNAIVVQKGGQTTALRTAFVRTRLEDWERAEAIATPYTRTQVARFSPNSRAILEIQSEHDLAILESIYSDSVLLGDDGPTSWGIGYAREFDLTNDSQHFAPRPQWEADGYRADEYSRWLRGDWRPIEELWAQLDVPPPLAGERRCAQPPYDTLPVPRAALRPGVVLSRDGGAWLEEARIADVALPLYEGRMIGLFDFSQKGWVSGRGRSAVWREIEWSAKRIEPQYLMARATYLSKAIAHRDFKVAIMDVTSTTNARTAIATPLAFMPCGHKTPTLTPDPWAVSRVLALAGTFSSVAMDYVIRSRMGGTSLVWSAIAECAVPRTAMQDEGSLAQRTARLALGSALFAPMWITLVTRAADLPWKKSWHLSRLSRSSARAALDAVVLKLFGCSSVDARHILAECDHPVGSRMARAPKGFWRVDKDLDPELRHTVLTLVAFQDLDELIRIHGGDCEKGIEAFLTQNNGEGWMLPNTLRLADYGLGQDDRAQQPQPVASRLGPRHLDWQLAQSAEESWQECHLHARNLLGTAGYLELLSETLRDAAPSEWEAVLAPAFELDDKQSLCRIFVPALAAAPLDDWDARLGRVGDVLKGRQFTMEPSDKIKLLAAMLVQVPEAMRVDGLARTRVLLGDSEFAKLTLELETSSVVQETSKSYGAAPAPTEGDAQRRLFE